MVAEDKMDKGKVLIKCLTGFPVVKNELFNIVQPTIVLEGLLGYAVLISSVVCIPCLNLPEGDTEITTYSL